MKKKKNLFLLLLNVYRDDPFKKEPDSICVIACNGGIGLAR